jgi:hypothetical protein
VHDHSGISILDAMDGTFAIEWWDGRGARLELVLSPDPVSPVLGWPDHGRCKDLDNILLFAEGEMITDDGRLDASFDLSVWAEVSPGSIDALKWDSRHTAVGIGSDALHEAAQVGDGVIEAFGELESGRLVYFDPESHEGEPHPLPEEGVLIATWHVEAP